MDPTLLKIGVIVVATGVGIYQISKAQRKAAAAMKEAARLLQESENPELASLGHKLEADAETAFVVTHSGSIEGDIAATLHRLRVLGWVALGSLVWLAVFLTAQSMGSQLARSGWLVVPTVLAPFVAMACGLMAFVYWLNLLSLRRHQKR